MANEIGVEPVTHIEDTYVSCQAICYPRVFPSLL